MSPASNPSADRLAIAPAGVRTLLRDATRREHDRVDGSPVMRELMAGRLPEGDYEQMLRALHRLFGDVERQHAVFLHHASMRGWAYASREKLLALDLGIAPDATGRQDAEAPHHAAPTTATAQGWGALYVIEGSTLGARLITAQLRRGFPDGVALRYFSHGADEPGHWPRFLRVLEHELADPATHADALAGARATFAAFSRTLEALA